MLFLLLVWMVVLVYHLPVAGVFSDGCGGGDNDGSGLAGCRSGSWFFKTILGRSH